MNRLNPYALTAAALLAVGRDITRYMATSPAGAADWLRTVAKGLVTMTQDANEHERIRLASNLITQAARELELAADESNDPEDEEMVIPFFRARVKELRELSDFLCPPKPCWPGNVIPFVPRRRA